MTLESQTESRLQSLLDLYRKGYRSAVIDQAVSKLVALESEQNRAELKRLEVRLAQYELQFGMRSEDFYRRFRAGELGDEMDLVEWSVFWEMHLAGRQRLARLLQNVP